jgi:ABC-type phosphate transport system substrate-binding protein
MTACCRWAIVLLALCISSAVVSSAKESVLTVIVNSSNPTESLSKIQLRALLMGEIDQWANKSQIILVQREPTSQAFQKTLRLILHMTEAEYSRWLLQSEFRGRKLPLVKVLNSDESASKFVFNVPGALAITEGVPSGSISSDIKILRVDGKLPGDPGYAFK